MNINFYASVILLIFYSFTFAQQTDWKVYNTSNSNLPVDQTHTIYIDEQNIKWIGTSSGLVKYDDSSWNIYDTTNSNLPSNYITCVESDGNNGIWIGTDKGLAHHNNDKWDVYTTENSVLKSNSISKIKFGGDATWFGTDKGLIKYQNDEWSIYDSDNSGFVADFVCSITIDQGGKIWIGTFDHFSFNGSLWTFDGSRWKYFRLKNHGLFSSFPDAIDCDSNNQIWLGIKGTNGGALVKIANDEWTIYDKNNSDYPGSGISSLIAENAEKWIASGSGLILFKNGIWNKFDKNNSGLPDDFVSDIAIDKFGNKWVATIGGGLAVYNMGGIISSSKNDDENIPNDFKLFTNYPNPFNPETVISYSIPVASYVQLKIYDVLGNEITTLVNEYQRPGKYSVEFRVKSDELSSGIYFYKLNADSFTEIKKMILIK